MAVKNKADAEKFQRQLLELLKDEPNRVCADCHARGPRWASWNLGVFICIRCAGMHRNLGVHIAKVKSVNLDTWTQEQVDNMLAWGNGIANEYYENKLPADFRRPKDDIEVEKLIRNKYDKKLYIHEHFDYATSAKQHPTSSRIAASGGEAASRSSDATSKFKKTSGRVEPADINAPTRSIPVVPLKTYNEAYVPPKVTAPKPAAKKATPTTPELPSLLQVSIDSAPAAAQPAPPANSDLVDLFGDMVSGTPPPSTAHTNLLQDTTSVVKEEPKKSVKDSIMSLYGSTPSGFPGQQVGGFPGQQGTGFPVQQGSGFPGQFGMGSPQQQMTSNGAFPSMQQQGLMTSQQQQQRVVSATSQFPQQFSNPVSVPQSNGSTPNQQLVNMQNPQFGNHQFGNQQPRQQHQFGNQPQQFGNQPQQFGNHTQHFGQQQKQFTQQQFVQFQRQQPAAGSIQNGTQTNAQNGAQNIKGVNNVQLMNNMQMMNNMQQMNNMQGPAKPPQAFHNQQINNGQGINHGIYMGNPSPQFGFNTQPSAVNQQQHLDSVQRQLQQLKVGQGQAGWPQASGSG